MKIHIEDDCAYIKVSKKKVAKSKELKKLTVIGDYDKRGNLVGVEILGVKWK